MKRQVFWTVFSLFTFFCLENVFLCIASEKDFEAQSQKKRKIKLIVDTVVKEGGTLQDAVRNVSKTYRNVPPELSPAQQEKLKKSVAELKKLLPPAMTLTVTFTSEKQVRELIQKVQELKKKVPGADFEKAKEELREDAVRVYPYIPVQTHSKVHIVYEKNGVTLECRGRFRPSSNPLFIHVGPYKIPISSIQENQRYRFSRAETEKIREKYVKTSLESKKRAFNAKFRQLIDKHEEELHFHDNDIFFVRKWYTLEEYTALVYRKAMKAQKKVENPNEKSN